MLCLGGLPALTLVLTTVRAHVAVGSALMLDLCIVIGVAALGGVRAGVVASVLASGLTNWFLTPPLHQLTVSDAENVVALTVFLFVTVVVSVLVARATRQSHEAAAARSHATALARSAATLIAASDPLPELLDQVRATFELQSAALFERSDGRWNEICSSGPTHADNSGGKSIEVESGNVKLVIWGGELGAVELDVLKAFAAQLAAALETIELRREAERAAVAGQADAFENHDPASGVPRFPNAVGDDHGGCNGIASFGRRLQRRRPSRAAR